MSQLMLDKRIRSVYVAMQCFFMLKGWGICSLYSRKSPIYLVLNNLGQTSTKQNQIIQLPVPNDILLLRTNSFLKIYMESVPLVLRQFALCFIFHFGDDVWHYDLSMSNHKKLMPKRYYAYRIMNNENEFNQLLRGGRSFQQYLVDMGAKIDEDRLRYTRMNQTSLRSTTYKGLTDGLNDDDDICNIGR